MDEAEDSLFEGMVLFTPSQLAGEEKQQQEQALVVVEEEEEELEVVKKQEELEVAKEEEVELVKEEEVQEASSSNSSTDPPLPSQVESEPLDENLFSDLTLVQPPDPPPTPSASRKKKRAAGLRVGYARDHLPLTASSSSSPPTSEPDADSPTLPRQCTDSEEQLELLRSRISAKLNLSRDLSASVSSSRKDSLLRRRKAAADLDSASARLRLLESQLQDACEREDFDAAQRISDALASADSDRLSLLRSLRDAQAACDAVDSQMQEALLSQIAAEQDSASLLRLFAQDAEKNAAMLLDACGGHFSKEMGNWLSSTESLHAAEIELVIQSQVIDQARSTLVESIHQAVASDQREKESLCRRKDALTEQLHHLLALVRDKEKEIAENDGKIEAIEERITGVVASFHQVQSGVDSRYDSLQAALSDAHLQSEALSNKRKEIEDLHAKEEARATKLRELALASEEEARLYEEVVDLRKRLQLSISNSRENRARLAQTEEKLVQDVQELQQQASAARASLQELSSTKSSIQQNISSFNQRVFFIDKRVPELEAEKKVAASTRNFKEAARLAAEAKSLNLEKDNLLIDLEKSSTELQKLEESIETTASQLLETEQQILSKEKEVAMARYQTLLLIAGAATAERDAALELGDTKEADLLLAEGEAASAEAENLKAKYDFEEESFANLPKHFISMELVSNLGGKELAQLAASIDLSRAQ